MSVFDLAMLWIIGGTLVLVAVIVADSNGGGPA